MVVDDVDLDELVKLCDYNLSQTVLVPITLIEDEQQRRTELVATSRNSILAFRLIMN